MLAPQQLLGMLLGRGVPYEHAAAMVANATGESSLNPAAIGDSGSSLGLWQHHGPRADGLRQFASAMGKDWMHPEAQIDYALSEPDTRRFLAQDFGSPEEASRWFTVNWERPANAEQRAEERLKYLPGGYTPQQQAMTGQSAMNDQMMMPPGLDMASLFAPQKPTFAQHLAQNPLLMMGLGMLANDRNPFGGALGALALAGAADKQPSKLEMIQGEYQLAKLEEDRRERLRKRKQEEAQREYLEKQAQKYEAEGRPDIAEHLRSGMADSGFMQDLVMLGEKEAPQVVDIGEGKRGVWNPATKTYEPVPVSGDFPEKTESLKPTEKVSVTNTIYDNFQSETKEDMEVMRRWETVKDYDPVKMTGEQDRILIVSLAKAIEPTSSVQQGEDEMVRAAGRKAPWIIGAWLQAKGEGLEEPQRKNFLSEIEKLASRAYVRRADAYGRYGKQLQELDFEPRTYLPTLLPFPQPKWRGMKTPEDDDSLDDEADEILNKATPNSNWRSNLPWQ